MSALEGSYLFAPKESRDNILTIYHGSEQIIRKPEFGKGKSYNDYGLGFYTTADKELAGEWAVLATGRDGYVNEYAFNLEGLNVLKLDTLDIKCGISVLLQHREGEYNEVVSERRMKFVEMFGVDISQYDVITGWRADDSFFTFTKNFLTVGLSLENLQKAMKFGELGMQICLKSKVAFEHLNFVASHKAQASEYYKSAKERDDVARATYRALPNKTQGTLIIDLIGR